MHRSARTLTEFAAAKAFLFVIYHGEKVMNIYSTHRYLCKFRVSIFLYSRSEKEDFETGVIGLYKSESKLRVRYKCTSFTHRVRVKVTKMSLTQHNTTL